MFPHSKNAQHFDHIAFLHTVHPHQTQAFNYSQAKLPAFTHHKVI